jgi:hypothetical protein
VLSKSHFGEKSFWSLLLVLSFLAYLFQAQFFLEGDVIYLIKAADRLREGGSYTDNFFETNPPMILYLYFPILALMSLLKITLMSATRLYLISLIFISLFLANYLLKKKALPALTRYLLLTTAGFVFLFLPFAQFGQREHLLLILTLPYWFLAALRAEKKNLALIPAGMTSLLAGVGFALKPFFLLPLIFIELYLLYRNKLSSLFRVETLTISCIFLVYLLSVFIFQPDYFKIILPLISKYYFLGAKQPWAFFLNLKPALFCFAAALAAPFFCLLSQERSLAVILSLALFGLTLSFLLPRVAWYYHVLPAYGLSYLLGALLIAELGNIFIAFGFSLLFLIIPALNGYGLLTSPITIKNSSDLNALIDFTQLAFPGKKVYCMSGTKACLILSAYANNNYVSRFPSLWVMYGLLKKADSPEVNQDRTFISTLLAEDLNLNKPDLFIFDRTETLGRMRTDKDYIAYFSKNAAFKAAWKNYHYLKTLGPYDLYTR